MPQRILVPGVIAAAVGDHRPTKSQHLEKD
jgi:hypothetical protein